MEWYYASGKERIGPVSEAQISSLVTAGTIRAETLVWNRSMTDWLPAERTKLWSGPPVLDPGATGETQRCLITGKTFSTSQMLRTEHGWVSGEGRDTYFQCLREGVPFPTPAGVTNACARGNYVVVPAKGASFPLRCVKTNEPVTADQLKPKKLWWCSPYIYLAILLNLLVVLILYYVYRKPVQLDIPLSANGRGVVRRHAFISLGISGVGVAMIVLGFLASQAIFALVIFGILVTLGGLIYASRMTPILRVAKMTKDGQVWLAGASKEFLASLPRAT
jgi:hypothetical protein